MGILIVKPGRPERGQDGSVTVRCDIDAPGLPRELWFKGAMSAPFEAPSEPNWAMLGLLYPAMALGLDIEIRGALCPQLLGVANHELQALLTAYNPGLRRIRVNAGTGVFPAAARRDGLATGYSAGVDSFATLAHHGKEHQPAYHVTHLSCFNVGAFGLPTPRNDPAELFRLARERAVEYAGERGYSWLTLDSNLGEFYSDGQRFGETHTLRNAAAALFFENAIGTYLYSASVPLTAFTPNAHLHMDWLDAVLVPMCSSARLTLQSAVGFLGRAAKTELVGRFPDSYTRLDVCSGKSSQRAASKTLNCTQCWKCGRTTLTLECLGLLERYAPVFDLEVFRRRRTKLLCMVARLAYGGSIIDAEVLERLRERGKWVPGWLLARLGSRL